MLLVFVFGGQLYKNNVTDGVVVFHMVLSFRYFTPFQVCVPYSGLITQCVERFYLNNPLYLCLVSLRPWKTVHLMERVSEITSHNWLGPRSGQVVIFV